MPSDLPSDEEVSRAAEACIAYWSHERDSDFWGVEWFQDVSVRPEMAETTWRLVSALCTKVRADEGAALAMIGSGPVEDYLQLEGEKGLERIEAAALTVPTLIEALRFVYTRDRDLAARVRSTLQAHGMSSA